MTPEDILEFWFDECEPDDWFQRDRRFDAIVRGRFGDTHGAAAAGELDHWKAAAPGCLAWIIVLDQFSRNLFRDDARAFAQDPAALAATKLALERGDQRVLPGARRTFLIMPLMHSENLDDQARCVELFRDWGDGYERNLAFAIAHRDIIARFGRFPHRNAVLGRTSTAEEREFLDTHGGF